MHILKNFEMYGFLKGELCKLFQSVSSCENQIGNEIIKKIMWRAYYNKIHGNMAYLNYVTMMVGGRK